MERILPPSALPEVERFHLNRFYRVCHFFGETITISLSRADVSLFWSRTSAPLTAIIFPRGRIPDGSEPWS